MERLDRLLDSFCHPLAPLPSGGMALAGFLHEVKQVHAPACDSYDSCVDSLPFSKQGTGTVVCLNSYRRQLFNKRKQILQNEVWLCTNKRL